MIAYAISATRYFLICPCQVSESLAPEASLFFISQRSTLLMCLWPTRKPLLRRYSAPSAELSHIPSDTNLPNALSLLLSHVTSSIWKPYSASSFSQPCPQTTFCPTVFPPNYESHISCQESNCHIAHYGSQGPSIPWRLHGRMDMRLACRDSSCEADVRRNTPLLTSPTDGSKCICTLYCT